MKMFSVEQLSKSYGEKDLFNNISFTISEKNRIGLIGVNGTGKSSLLKLIAGIDLPDTGEMSAPKDYTIGYLPQEPEVNEEISVLDQVFLSEAKIIRLLKVYEETLLKLEIQPENEEIQQQLFRLQKDMDANQAWEANSAAKTILMKLGITDFKQKMAELSGGQRKRVALAQVLIETPDLLILDEPTNHLDYESVKWLEDYLSKYSGSLLLVTHDRYFLDYVTNKIFELDNGSLYEYKGNYQDFIEAKALREEQMAASEDKRRNLYRNELAWMRRGAKARSTKQKARIQRFESIESQLGSVPAKEQVEMSFKGSRLGKQVLEFSNAQKSFGDKCILKDFDWLVKPGDRFGIVGKNGSGKSTLLNMIAGNMVLDSGEIKIGQTVKIAYFQQNHEEMDENMRMIEYVREYGDVIETTDGETVSAAQMLERFLFPMNSHGTLIRKLSGGEKRRLYLLRLLMQKPNVLLLDEPTNDLDTQTLTVLEDYIEEFPGVVITVSHDRYFLDKTSTQLLVFQGEGMIVPFYGIYSEYLEKEAQESKEKAAPIKMKTVAEETPKKKKMTYMEKKEWEEIEEKIASAEEKLENAQNDLENVGSDFDKARVLMEEIEQYNENLEMLIERWSYLSELAD
ncbi:ABC-F family ATP-binding cassette domain-containing protein [Falsibacillus pallidus]|uniref:ATP-binding cassette subfamily F protein uup n=1 Tax=Falsibacillus pallidus TaxID=493781 RepID=A0A370GIN0_9BACI|nr:ABC-F family ATP-binding cassette domain-containing protein [Falsibacillus pallidus]RDI43066.1 ATP-binding cassette subfamily F protein uup [Falsibacillus pallidus]